MYPSDIALAQTRTEARRQAVVMEPHDLIKGRHDRVGCLASVLLAYAAHEVGDKPHGDGFL